VKACQAGYFPSGYPAAGIHPLPLVFKVSVRDDFLARSGYFLHPRRPLNT